MIASMKIEGFQSHVESALNLGAGLNVITGPSGAGKTAIIRAIKWVAFNEPQGEAFVNEAVGEAVVTITLTSGQIITKRRRKGKTSYLLQITEDDEGSVYEKSEVPDDVKRWLQIEKQTFGDFETALNFSYQLDAPFLISETPSAGAKILGKLAGTESVDLAIKGISKDTYGSRQDRANAEKDIERIAGSMLAYAHIDDAKEAVDLAEMLLEQIETNNTKYEGLKEARNIYEAMQDRLVKISATLDRLAIVPQLEEDLKNIEEAQRRYDLLLDLYARYNYLAKTVERLEEKLAAYYGVQEAAEAVEVITKEAERLTLFTSLSTAYQKYTEDYSKTLDVLLKVKDLPAAYVDLGQVETDLQLANDLKLLKAEFGNVTRRAEIALERVESFQGLTEGEALLRSTDEALARYTLLKDLSNSYEMKAFHDRRAHSALSLAEIELEDAQKEEAAAWEAAGGICPLCEQPHERGTC
jgi:DNA repair protein SbcC/Rad50